MRMARRKFPHRRFARVSPCFVSRESALQPAAFPSADALVYLGLQRVCALEQTLPNSKPSQVILTPCWKTSFSTIFLSAVLLSLGLLFPCALPCSAAEAAGTANTNTKRQAASAQFARAEDQRAGLNDKPANKRTLAEYKQVVSTYRRVYLITPVSYTHLCWRLSLICVSIRGPYRYPANPAKLVFFQAASQSPTH